MALAQEAAKNIKPQKDVNQNQSMLTEGMCDAELAADVDFEKHEVSKGGNNRKRHQ